MKSAKSLKLIIFILLSVLITVFTGCGGTALSPDEIKITDAIHGYFQAISDQDWDGARSYCVYESTAYDDVNEIKELWYPDSGEIEEIDVDFIVEDIGTIIITGEYAEAQVYIKGILLYNGVIVEEYPGETLFVYLQKIGDNWKLYNIKE
jgi:ABC-type cobalt transport system substrate-binding protein